MAERSFVGEVQRLRLGAGEVFRGEGILAVTKALLESGVSYVAGYQGAPISHLMDVLADAEDILVEHGIRFESSASEATAAATLAASVNYPLRGAVTFKGPVGVNVASDALANLASGGVTGGALVVVGEDYGEGSSIMQERTHAFAMKSQIWLLDPRPDLPSMVAAVKNGFALSEASRTPVMLMLRIRACHVHGRFVASANRTATFAPADALAAPRRDTGRIVLPPATYAHEQEKVAERWPAALAFIEEHALNETFAGAPGADDVGIVVQGGHYNALVRALERLGLADVYGRSQVPLHVLNVTYPLVPRELVRFCAGKRAVLLVEEGQPNFIEQNLATILRQADLQTALHGKDILPAAGEYTGVEVLKGTRAFLERYGKDAHPRWRPRPSAAPSSSAKTIPVRPLADVVHARPPGFCTGCPERPIFSAMKLVERELGPHHVSADIGCHLFSILPPFSLGNTTMGYGLGSAAASAFQGGRHGDKRAIAVMGDGGFWHNGLTSGIANAVFNRSDHLTIVVDNNYTSATGGQDLLSSKGAHAKRSTGHAIERAVRGVGIEWVRTIRRTYDVAAMRDALREALTTKERGPKVLIAQSECQLNRQRRIKPRIKAQIAAGERVVRERFGVDADTCTGDHSCIRLSGCPSLSIRPNPDPLRTDPVAAVLDSCVGCGVCGEVAHAAVLCPSFYKARIVTNPTARDRFVARVRGALIGWWQRRDEQRRARLEIGPLSHASPGANDERSFVAPRPHAAADSLAHVGADASRPPGAPERGHAPIKIAILAMGGEGGGVLADWIVDLGEQNGWLAQTTSVPGVAQRTGATIYYVELYPEDVARRDGAEPVFALMPLPGDVDVVLASELMECGRAVQRGLVTPERTTLIASTHRVYSIAEKTALGDGRVASDALLAHAARAAQRFVRFDMAEAAERSGSVVSAVLFGALAGTGVLPFARAQFEATIARGGVGVQPSLRAFADAFARAGDGDGDRGRHERAATVAGARQPDAPRTTNDGGAPRAAPVAAPEASALDGTTDAPPASPRSEAATSGASSATESPRAARDRDATAPEHRLGVLLDRIATTFAPDAHAILHEGVRRLLDYQDLAHAELYLERVARIANSALEAGAAQADALVAETARHLALWMSYEDTMRVAQLKTRGARFARVRSEVRAGADQVLAIDEYFHPRVQEIAETLPAAIGRRIERAGWLREVVERRTRRGRVVTTTSLSGFFLLRAVAAMRRWRRNTTRYAAEDAAIEAWLERIARAAARDPELAVEIARCQRLVKGYSDTHARGVRNFDAVMAAVEKPGAAMAPATVRELRDAALADEHGHALDATLARHALA